LIVILTGLACFSPAANATQADSTGVTITGQAAGPTPFISNLSLHCTNIAVLNGVRFTIVPKVDCYARPLSAFYSKAYLKSRGYVDPATGNLIVPVFGLYQAYANTVNLVYRFGDGSLKNDSVGITTATWSDACDFTHATVLQARTTTTALSYDYMLVGSKCGTHSPAIIDSDGKLRWTGPMTVTNYTPKFYKNGIYQADGAKLYRFELDGTVTQIADYSNDGVVDLHHNIDMGRSGFIIDVNTPEYVESTNLEIDPVSGQILNKWVLGDIIASAMQAGGDDPKGFVRKVDPSNPRYDFDSPQDWFHNNSTTYRKVDNTLIISSRENFVVALDYDTHAIKWILGDTTKKWYQYPSLRAFALTVPDGTVAPVGQHALSIGKDRTLMLFDNGQPSQHQSPAGPVRYSAPRKYQLNLKARTATEVWSYPYDQSLHSSFCSSVYEDAPGNYVIDYANVNGWARILGLTPAGDKVFEYSYSTGACEDAYRTMPIHWENITYPPPATKAAADSSAAVAADE
jgi:hypothetical protein